MMKTILLNKVQIFPLICFYFNTKKNKKNFPVPSI